MATCNQNGLKSHDRTVKQRKLILHIDLRSTILVADSVTSTTIEQGLNSYMTCVTWGKLDSNGQFVWLEHPISLTKPSDDSISYYTFLENQLVRNARNRAALRKATGNFTHTTIGARHYDIFEKHRKLLEWHYEPVEYLSLKSNDIKYHYTLPSFVRCLNVLQEEKREFSVILRTYGLDAHNMLKALEAVTVGKHPQFSNKLNLVVNNQIGNVYRTDKISVRLAGTGSGGSGGNNNDNYTTTTNTTTTTTTTNTKRISNYREIYNHWSNTNGICAYVDDFNHWQKYDYHYLAGKPLFIDLDDEHVQHIFFDDNARLQEDSIVDVKLLGKPNKTISPSVREIHDCILVQADLLEAISNMDYFVDKIKVCEKNYANLVFRYGRNREMFD